MDQDLTQLLARIAATLERLEARLPDGPAGLDWHTGRAFRWQCNPLGRCALAPLAHDPTLGLDDLLGIDPQRAAIRRNTAQFVAGLPANHCLLWGPKGTGKSSLIKALLNEFGDDGLRLVELAHPQLADLAAVVAELRPRPERFILFFDDLSFEPGDPTYKSLKAALEGSLAALPENVLVYATSNRRHLLPEYASENREARIEDGELHHGEAVEEKLSLSERFGLWLALHPFSQEQYLAIVAHWLGRLGVDAAAASYRQEALRWALAKGSRSGRSAQQFARDYAGRLRLGHS